MGLRKRVHRDSYNFYQFRHFASGPTQFIVLLCCDSWCKCYLVSSLCPLSPNQEQTQALQSSAFCPQQSWLNGVSPVCLKHLVLRDMLLKEIFYQVFVNVIYEFSLVCLDVCLFRFYSTFAPKRAPGKDFIKQQQQIVDFPLAGLQIIQSTYNDAYSVVVNVAPLVSSMFNPRQTRANCKP